MKAIRLYMQEKYINNSPEQDVHLLPTKQVKLTQVGNRYSRDSAFTGSFAQLAAYAVTSLPAEGAKLQLGDKTDDLVFSQYTEEKAGNQDQNLPSREDLA